MLTAFHVPGHKNYLMNYSNMLDSGENLNMKWVAVTERDASRSYTVLNFKAQQENKLTRK